MSLSDIKTCSINVQFYVTWKPHPWINALEICYMLKDSPGIPNYPGYCGFRIS